MSLILFHFSKMQGKSPEKQCSVEFEITTHLYIFSKWPCFVIFGEKLKGRLLKGSLDKRVRIDLPVPLPVPTLNPPPSPPPVTPSPLLPHFPKGNSPPPPRWTRPQTPPPGTPMRTVTPLRKRPPVKFYPLVSARNLFRRCSWTIWIAICLKQISFS